MNPKVEPHGGMLSLMMTEQRKSIDSGNEECLGEVFSHEPVGLLDVSSSSCAGRIVGHCARHAETLNAAKQRVRDSWNCYFQERETVFTQVYLNALMFTTSKVAIIGCHLEPGDYANVTNRYALDELFVPSNEAVYPIIPLRAGHSVGAATSSAVEQPHNDAMAELFASDSQLASETLNAILEDGDQGELLVTLGQIAKAKGLTGIAEQANVNRSQLYRTLSAHGNPSLNSFIAILKAMGLRLSVQPIEG